MPYLYLSWTGKRLCRAALIFSFLALAVSSGFASSADALNECNKQIGSAPRTDLQPCLVKKISQADAEMRQAYSKVEQSLKTIDSASTTQALASLKTSQGAFLRFRQAECKRISDAAMGGSGAGDFLQSCRVNLTRQRTKQLTEDGGN
jgi:uncharacterized protein YecT (DUF1311 family)